MMNHSKPTLNDYWIEFKKINNEELHQPGIKTTDHEAEEREERYISPGLSPGIIPSDNQYCDEEFILTDPMGRHAFFSPNPFENR